MHVGRDRHPNELIGMAYNTIETGQACESDDK